jgi:phosphoglycerate kinase
VANLVPRKYAGFALKKEVDFLTTAIEHPDRPLAAVVGGVKVSTKIDVLFSLVGKVDFLLIGGAMVFTFYRALGYAVGDSFVEESSIQTAADILREAVEHKTVVRLAADCVVAETDELRNEKSEGHSPRDIPIKTTSMDTIPNGWTGLDVGKLTINEFGRELYQCHTILWNGPLGMFEDPRFAEGTRAMLEVIVNCETNTGAKTIICGGDTVAAITTCGFHFDQFSHVSMGGGAALKLLSGKELPGVAALQA